MMLCCIRDCDREASSKAGFGMCNAHYHRLRAGKPLMGGIQKRGAGWISDHGYRYIGNRAEHRRVVEAILGRRLSFNEVVHHKDGDHLNNHPDNLEVMDRADHIRAHVKGKTNEQRAAEKAEFGYCLAGSPQ